jgi:hypothetical protein
LLLIANPPVIRGYVIWAIDRSVKLARKKERHRTFSKAVVGTPI